MIRYNPEAVPNALRDVSVPVILCGYDAVERRSGNDSVRSGGILGVISQLMKGAGMSTAMKNRPGLSLRQTFDLYVRAVQCSDLVGLFTTVTSQDHFVFLTARGEMITTRQGYYDFHRKWFEESDWEMPVEIIEVHEEENSGYTVGIFRYRGRNPAGITHTIDSYFTLVFHREEGMWKVIADVCTPLRCSEGSQPCRDDTAV